MNIQHKKTENACGSGEPICELWIDLPSGEKLFFADVFLFEWSTDAETDKRIEAAKARIAAGLRELMSAYQ